MWHILKFFYVQIRIFRFYMEFRKQWNHTWFKIKIITLRRKNNTRRSTILRGLQIFTQGPHRWVIWTLNPNLIFILPMILPLSSMVPSMWECTGESNRLSKQSSNSVFIKRPLWSRYQAIIHQQQNIRYKGWNEFTRFSKNRKSKQTSVALCQRCNPRQRHQKLATTLRLQTQVQVVTK